MNTEKMNWLEKEIRNCSDMIIGAMNRICVTTNDKERLSMEDYMHSYISKLIVLTECRSHNFEGLDEIYNKYSIHGAHIEL